MNNTDTDTEHPHFEFVKGPRRFRITSPGYVAVLVVEDGIVVQGAPILRRWVGLEWLKVREELRRRANTDVEDLGWTQ